MQRSTLSALIVLSVAAPTSAEQVELRFDPARTVIEFTLDATMHKVHGTFQLVRGTIRYDPETGEASGTIVVDARSGDSGNAKRDRDMHGKVLKSEAHPEIVLVPERVVGDLPSEGSRDMTVVGGFRIGGARHTIEIPITVTVKGDEAEIQAQFEVPYVEWGLKDPSKFVLRVAKEVAVTVTAHATITPVTDEEAN